jgi:HEAT repeat protein
MTEAELLDRWAELSDRPTEATATDIERTLGLIGPEIDPQLVRTVLGTVEGLAGRGSVPSVDEADAPWDERDVRRLLFACFERILTGPYGPEHRRIVGERFVANGEWYQVSAAETGLLEPLTELLCDDHPEVRRVAASGLGMLAESTEIDAETLVEAGAVRSLAATQDDPEPAVQRAVVEALREVFRWTDPDVDTRDRVLGTLVSRFDDPDPTVRETAIDKFDGLLYDSELTVSDIETFGAIETLVDRLDDESDDVVASACTAVWRVAIHIDDGPAGVERAGAVSAITDILDQPAEQLPEPTTTSDPVGAAVLSLGEIGSAAPELVEPAVPKLFELLGTAKDFTDNTPDAVGKIARADPSVLQPAIDDLTTTLRQGTDEEKRQALAILDKLGDGEPTAVHPAVDGLVTALEAGDLPPAAVQPVVDSLIASLDDDDAGVRAAAAVKIGTVASADGRLVTDALDPLLDALCAAPWERAERDAHEEGRTDDRQIANAIRRVVDGTNDIEPADVIERVVAAATTDDPSPFHRIHAARVLWAFSCREFTVPPYAADEPLVDRVETNDVFDPLVETTADTGLAAPDGRVRTRVACVLLRLRPSFSVADAEPAREIVRARLRMDDPVPDKALARDRQVDRKRTFATMAVGMVDDIARHYPDRIEPLEPALETATETDSSAVQRGARQILERLHSS